VDPEPLKIYKHSITRTVTEIDNLLFSTPTHNTAWLRLDEEYAKMRTFGKRIVNSNFTLSLIACDGVTGMNVCATTANLGPSDVKLLKPVFFGDTIYNEADVLS
jgi:acyl dehydratase